MAEEMSSYTVYTTAGKYEVLPAAAKAILGEYVEDGENHGRKVYRRRSDAEGKKGPTVLLFYFDESKGKALMGWWFGDKIGAGQVWARCESDSETPPQKGWRCPVDGAIQKHVVCMSKLQAKEEVIEEPTENAGDESMGVANVTVTNKRSGTTVAPGAKRPKISSQPWQLSSKLGEDAPASVKKLVGEYIEQKGLNHGKKTYLKKDSSTEQIWLYYWDNRDGWDYSGWWFGSKVGGALVYARSQQHSTSPATRGWRIPHDGPVRHDVTLKEKDFDEDAQMPESDRLTMATEMVKGLEEQTDKAIELSSSVWDKEDALEEAMRAAYQMLSSKISSIEDGKQALVRHGKAAKQQNASEQTLAQLSLFEERLDASLQKASAACERAEEKLKVVEERLAEERDARALETTLPLALELTMQAEIAADGAVTKETASQARSVLNKAKSKVSAAVKAARRFAPEAQKIALTEFTALQDRCGAVEQRLAPWGGKVAEKPSQQAAGKPDGGQADGSWAHELREDDDDMDLDDDEDLSFDDAASSDESLRQVIAKVSGAELSAKEALKTVESGTTGSSNGSSAIGVLKENRKNVNRLQKGLHKALATSTGKATKKNMEELRALGPRLQAVRSRLEAALVEARQIASRLQRQTRKEDTSEEPADATIAMFEAVGLAEEAVEAVSMEATDLTLLQAQHDKSNDVVGVADLFDAVDRVQTNADRAQDSIASARAKVDICIGKVKAATRAQSAEQKEALANIAPLRNRLVAAQKRLNPYRRTKKDFDGQRKANKALSGTNGKMAALEADIKDLKKVLQVDFLSEDEVAAAEKSCELAHKSFVETRNGIAELVGGVFQDSLADVRERLNVSRAEIEELRLHVRERRQSLGGTQLIKSGEHEAEKAQEWSDRIAEVEAPWKDGCETLPEDKATPALQAAEKLTAELEPVVKNARAVLAQKAMEAKDIAEEGVRLRTAAQLQSFAAKVDAVLLKLSQLKVNTFARKTKMLFPEAVEAVVAAEAKSAIVVKAGEELSKDNLETISKDALEQACKKVGKPAEAALASCKSAKALIDAKQKDPRFWSSPSFHTQLSKLSNRLETAEGQVSGLQTAVREAERNRSTTLKEQRDALANVAKQIADAEILTLPLGDERPSDTSSTAKVVENVQSALAAWHRGADKFKNDPHGAMKLAMARVFAEAQKLQIRVDDIKESSL